MGQVVDFLFFKNTGQVRIVNVDEDKPTTCPRPFHDEELLVNVVREGKNHTKCGSCSVLVRAVMHPSFDGTKWYEVGEEKEEENGENNIDES